MEKTKMIKAGTTIVIRLELDKHKVSFGQIATVIGETGGDVVGVDVTRSGKVSTTRDLTVQLTDASQTDDMVSALKKTDGVQVIHVSDSTFLTHLGGKIEVTAKLPIKTRDDLSKVYTPGVARVSMAIHEQPDQAHTLTIKRNTVAVVTDGSAVLGLGNVGPLAALPVMEGKAMLFKQLAGVDAFPICLETQDTEEIIQTVKRIAPTFGGINLEDISAPRCFEIERRLGEELDIPIFHDDQHGTAVVLLAGILNSTELIGKSLADCKIVLCGIGAAGIACTKILLAAGATNIIGVDREGALTADQVYTNEPWNWYAGHTNPFKAQGKLSDVIEDTDIFIGLSAPNVLSVSDVKRMASDAIVFAMANPMPEIAPEEAEPYVRIMATGRSDYPNQINNVLCFPGLFRGVLDCRASRITEGMKLAAARAIADTVARDELNELYIIPSVFNSSVAENVSAAVKEAAYRDGVARRQSQLSKMKG